MTKLHRFDYFETITVLVGLEDTKFTVPKGIVGDESQFSQLACTGKWKEAAEQIVRLPEANSHSFGVFVGWLHTSVLEFSVTAEDDPLPKYDRDVSAECYDLVTEAIVDCFILGDMLQCQRCCNALVDELIRLIEGCGWLPGMDLHKEVLVKLLHSSTMRKLMADYIAFDLQPQEFLENVGWPGKRTCNSHILP